MSSNGPQLMTGAFVLLNLLIIIAVGVIGIYGFILLVKFLRAGTKAFNIYIQKNSISNSERIKDGWKEEN